MTRWRNWPIRRVSGQDTGIVTKKIAELEGALGDTPPDMDTLEQLKTALEEKRALLKDLDERILAY